MKRSFMFFSQHQVGLLGGRSYQGALACETYVGRGEVPKGFWWENVRETDHGSHRLNRRITLIYIFKT
jgi:hypothetical protein